MRLRNLFLCSGLAGALSILLPGTLAAQLVNEGANIHIEPGTAIHVAGAVENADGGHIELGGALIVEGDLSNAGTFSAEESGELMFAGASSQTITGLGNAPIAIFTAAGPGAVVLGSPLQVGAELWLDGGIIDLRGHDLRMLRGSAIHGTPSAGSMVATTGTGVLSFAVDSLGSYTFPIGTLEGGPAYTPVALDLFDAVVNASTFITARVTPESRSINPSRNNFVNRAWFLAGSPGFVLRDASATFVWDAHDEVGEIGNLFGGLFADSQLFLLESVDPEARQFTARVGRLGGFTAGEPRAFEDPVLTGGEPPNLQLPPSLDSEGGAIDLASAYGNMAGFSFGLGDVSQRDLFDRIAIVDGRLEVQVASGRVGESAVTLFVTNEYGVTTSRVVYITEQPDPKLVRSGLNELTGYFEQDFLLENISAVRPLDIVDIRVARIPAAATLARATLSTQSGTLQIEAGNGEAWVRIQELLMPGEALTLRLEYVSSTRRVPEDVALSYGGYGLYRNATVKDGWLRLAPLGWFHPTEGRWAYHQSLGWVYPLGNDTANLPLWRHDHGWLWVSDSHFPNFYDYGVSSWIYYLPWTTQPAWFFDHTTQDWSSR